MNILFIIIAISLAISRLAPIAFAAATPTPSTSSGQAPTGKLSPTPAGQSPLGGTSPTPQPTVSDSDIRTSLQDRLKKAAEEKSDAASQILGANQKRAIVGTLKDLTNNTLTIQLKAGGTKLAALTDKTAFIRKGKTVEQGDLVIGDYTIAMGYINGNNILDARRVVAVEAPDEKPERKIFIGTVSEADAKKKRLTVVVERAAELGGPETLTITVPKTSDLDVSKLEADSKLIIVAVSDEKTPTSFVLKAYKTL